MTAKSLNGQFKIVLASASPRRAEILNLAGIEFNVWPSDKEETPTKLSPREVCMELARTKALDVASSIKTYGQNHPDVATGTDTLVIGADTIVAKDGTIFGKPKDDEDAVRMLKELSGCTHSVFTGVCLVFMSADGRAGEHSFYEETKVTFYPLDDDEIEDYVGREEVTDKAGAYGIQAGAAPFVKGIDGDFYNVVGLPLSRILQEIKRLLSDV